VPVLPGQAHHRSRARRGDRSRGAAGQAQRRGSRRGTKATEREARFREQMQAEGQKGKLLDRKFQEGLKKAKDSPDPPKRPFDYD
jgi:hypothetical protein